MLHIESFTFNPFSENTYLVWNEDKECIIVDPGMMSPHEEETLQEFIVKNELKPTKIVNTHAHIDHILGINFVKKQYNIPFYLHDADDVILRNAKISAAMFGLSLDASPTKDYSIEAGSVIELGSEKLHVLFTPGHSPGSISLYAPASKFVISGDVLFQESIGRTDLPGGDFEILKQSIIEQLYTLPEDTIVYSGHGMPTHIKHEKVYNPFVHVNG